MNSEPTGECTQTAPSGALLFFPSQHVFPSLAAKRMVFMETYFISYERQTLGRSLNPKP